MRGKGAKNQPANTPGLPVKPNNLSERASAEWDRLAKELRSAGIDISPAHRAALAAASTISADIAADWNELQSEGAYHVGKNGITAHPALKRLDALRRDLLKALALLGLRAPLAGEPEAPKDPLETLLDS